MPDSNDYANAKAYHFHVHMYYANAKAYHFHVHMY